MNKPNLSAFVAIAVIASSAGEGRVFAAPAKNGVSPALITPLTPEEIKSGIGPGLGCSFDAGKSTFLIVASGEALLKPSGIVRHITLDDDRSLSIINFGGSFGTRQLRIIIDRDEDVTSHGDELTVRKARLTFRQNEQESTVVGLWSCGA